MNLDLCFALLIMAVFAGYAHPNRINERPQCGCSRYNCVDCGPNLWAAPWSCHQWCLLDPAAAVSDWGPQCWAQSGLKCVLGKAFPSTELWSWAEPLAGRWEVWERDGSTSLEGLFWIASPSSFKIWGMPIAWASGSCWLMVTGSQPFRTVMLTRWENCLDLVFFLQLLGDKKFLIKVKSCKLQKVPLLGRGQK